MKKVCVNRLKAEVDKLQYFINSMEHQEDTLEQLFQCIYRLFENEVGHGGQQSIIGPMNATNGLLNSHSSIFNSKHNFSGFDSVGGGMSFGKATEDGFMNLGMASVFKTATGNINNALAANARNRKSE